MPWGKWYGGVSGVTFPEGQLSDGGIVSGVISYWLIIREAIVLLPIFCKQ